MLPPLLRIEIVGIHADLGGDENGVAGEVDEGDQARGGMAAVPVVEIATANFCGCAAGPTGLMALTTGR